MTSELTYKDYTSNEDYMEWFTQYQKGRAEQPRESDKMLLRIISDLVQEGRDRKNRPRLLDLGCSTGNLLSYLKRRLPDIELWGVDLAPNAIAECRRNPDLEDVHFETMDILKLHLDKPFDIIVANAALMFFDEGEFNTALRKISEATNRPGWFVAFDLFHPFEQEVTVVEKSRIWPGGLKLHLRSYARVAERLQWAGFSAPAMVPFRIPIDLPIPQEGGDLTSYSVRTDTGERMCFRGALFQPWCFMTASKSGMPARDLTTHS